MPTRIAAFFLAILSIGASVADAIAAGPAALDAAARKEVVVALAEKLASEYAVAETAEKMASVLRAKVEANAYDGLTAPHEFARALTQELEAVAHDKHLRVTYSDQPPPVAGSAQPRPDMTARMRKMNGAIPKVEILPGNVGYMRINGVPQLAASRDAIAAAFAFLRNTDALILDNRANGGGDPNTVAFYMSYLSEGEPYVVNTFHRRKENRVVEFKTTNLGELSYGAKKPVFVLTSGATFSGGEELAYDVQAVKRGTIVGAVTGGGANPGGVMPLPRQFEVFMPDARAVNPVTGGNWEGVGVMPDVEVAAADALHEAHRLAVARLSKEASDSFTRTQLDVVTVQLELSQPGSKEKPLAQVQLVGNYRATGMAGLQPLAVTLRDGSLYQQIAGTPDYRLVSVSGNRYRIEGLPEGFFSIFTVRDGKTHLLLEQPQGPMLLEKQ
jgi:retinol-binding protein 3